MANSLFRRKTIDSILTDAEKGDAERPCTWIKRVLTVRDLTFLGLQPSLAQEASVRLARQFSMVVPVLYFYLLLQVLPVHLPHFVIQSLPVAFPWQAVHILMLMQALGSYLHG